MNNEAHRSMNRFQAAGIHLGISFLIALLLLCLVFFVWYPEPYFQAGGGDHLILILVIIDISVGPLLTLIVFDPNKKLLKLDLSVIAILQLGFLLYGASVITQARPAFVVFAVDRFVLVSATELTDEDLKSAPEGFNSLPWTGPKMATAELPEDPKERSDLLMGVLSGKKDIERSPKYYVDYDSSRDLVSEKAHDLSVLNVDPDAAKALKIYIADQGLSEAKVGWLPLMGRAVDMLMLIDRQTGLPLRAFDINPWKQVRQPSEN